MFRFDSLDRTNWNEIKKICMRMTLVDAEIYMRMTLVDAEIPRSNMSFSYIF